MMKRREIITLLGGAAAWPFAARAQQGDRIRSIGLLGSLDENDPDEKARFSAFTQALADLGWTDGRNVRIDVRWASSVSLSALTGCKISGMAFARSLPRSGRNRSFHASALVGCRHRRLNFQPLAVAQHSELCHVADPQ